MDRSALYRADLLATSARTRLTSIFIVIAYHALALFILLWAGSIAPAPTAQASSIEVNVLPGRVQYKVAEEKPKYRPITPPKLWLMPPPDVIVDTPDPSPITVALPPSVGTGTNQAALDDYLTRLHDHIGRYMIYPLLARVNFQQGTAQVHFTLDDNNHVIFAEIKKSSGVSLLDKEALAMIKRAEPLPPRPAAYLQRHEFLLPVQFILPVMNTTRRFGGTP